VKVWFPLKNFRELHPEFPGLGSEQQKLQTKNQTKGMTPMNTQIQTLMSQRIFNSNTCRILFATCLSALCLAALSAQAPPITVMNSNESGPGSLHQALVDANDGDTINFDGSLHYIGLYSGGELVVDKSVTISGPGAANLTLDNNGLNRVFHITNAVTV